MKKPKPPVRRCDICSMEFQPRRAAQFICSRGCFKNVHSGIETRSKKLHDLKKIAQG